MNKKVIRDLMIIGLLLVGFPLLLRGGGPVLGVVLVAMIAVATVAMLPFCLTLGLLFAGGIQVFNGFSDMRNGIGNGMSTLGFGVLFFTGGILVLFLSIWFYKKSIPWVVRKLKTGANKKNEIIEEKQKA